MINNTAFYDTLLSNSFSYLPNILLALLFLIVGLIVGQLVYRFLHSFLMLIKIDLFFTKLKVASESTVHSWVEAFAQIVKWSLVTIFAVTGIQVLGLSQINTLLTGLVFYIPNILISVFILFLGVVAAQVVSRVLHSWADKSHLTIAYLSGSISSSIILFFTALIVLNQLGIAQELIKILFMGIVFALALSIGLAFGLGGKDTAKEILDEVKIQLQRKKK